jgi:hypothetical protein
MKAGEKAMSIFGLSKIAATKPRSVVTVSPSATTVATLHNHFSWLVDRPLAKCYLPRSKDDERLAFDHAAISVAEHVVDDKAMAFAC